MSPYSYPVPQRDPPLSPRLTLPSMYDLPSEDPEEPGLPDEFHDLQPQLLSRTLQLADYASHQWFTGTDINLYYDVTHPLWHKRPDWFLAVGVPRLYDGIDLRSSYVVWQEGQNPLVVIELLSPSTEAEDLGRFTVSQPLAPSAPSPLARATPVPSNGNSDPIPEIPPRKFDVYERILRVPYYITYSRHTGQLRWFQLIGAEYVEQPLNPHPPQIWLAPLNLGLGLWQGTFEGIPQRWLRWCDQAGHWIPTDTEVAALRAEQETVRAEQATARAEQERQAKEAALRAQAQAQAQLQQVIENLVKSGMTLTQVAQLTGLPETQIETLWNRSQRPNP